MSLILALALTAAVVEPKAAQPAKTKDLTSMCVMAVQGFKTYENLCMKSIMVGAELLRSGDLGQPIVGSCLAPETLVRTDLIWRYLDYVHDRSPDPESDAATTVTAAMFDKVPCGWRED